MEKQYLTICAIMDFGPNKRISGAVRCGCGDLFQFGLFLLRQSKGIGRRALFSNRLTGMIWCDCAYGRLQFKPKERIRRKRQHIRLHSNGRKCAVTEDLCGSAALVLGQVEQDWLGKAGEIRNT